MTEKSKYKLYIIIGFCSVCISMMILLEGGFHLSTLKADELNKALPEGNYALVMENTKQDDVIVQVYCNEKHHTFLVMEFSKNILFPRYRLTEKHFMPTKKHSFTTVISSALHDYAYQVDYQTMTIDIAEGQLSWDNIRLAVLQFILGISIIASSFYKLWQCKKT